MTKDASFGVIPIHEPPGEPGPRRFLVVHQMKGHWGFPKGHPDEGETPTQTALRELAEETGITECELIGGELFIERYAFLNKHYKRVDKTVTFFLGRVGDMAVSVQPEEVQGYAWLTADEVSSRLTFPEAKALFGRVLEYLDTQELH